MTQYDWILGIPVQTDVTNFEWVLGVPYIITEQIVAAVLWRKIAYETEPPVAGWNKIKREAGTGWRKILYEGE